MQFAAIWQPLWGKTEAYPKAVSESTDCNRVRYAPYRFSMAAPKEGVIFVRTSVYASYFDQLFRLRLDGLF